MAASEAWLDQLKVKTVTLGLPGDEAYVWYRGDGNRIKYEDRELPGGSSTFDEFVQQVAGFKGVSLQDDYSGPAAPPKPASELPYTPIDQVDRPTPEESD